ncbi:MAG TPA: hypothetical protein DHV85_22865 [Candidatus Accumulibacter sp.]|nr:hypothetical protein [Accumulibacter sp.]
MRGTPYHRSDADGGALPLMAGQQTRCGSVAWLANFDTLPSSAATLHRTRMDQMRDRYDASR